MMAIYVAFTRCAVCFQLWDLHLLARGQTSTSALPRTRHSSSTMDEIGIVDIQKEV